MSNIGLSIMSAILMYVGPATVARYYLIPYLVSLPLQLLSSRCVSNFVYSKLTNHW